MKDRDKIMHFKQKYKITNFTTYQDLRHAIYDYEMKHLWTLYTVGRTSIPMNMDYI